MTVGEVVALLRDGSVPIEIPADALEELGYVEVPACLLETPHYREVWADVLETGKHIDGSGVQPWWKDAGPSWRALYEALDRHVEVEREKGE